MRAFKWITNTFNSTFVNILLALFYGVGIGSGAVIKSFLRKRRTSGSYWEREDAVRSDLNSPY